MKRFPYTGSLSVRRAVKKFHFANGARTCIGLNIAHLPRDRAAKHYNLPIARCSCPRFARAHRIYPLRDDCRFMNFWEDVWRQTPLQLSDFPVLKVTDDQHDGWLAFCIMLTMPDHWHARERRNAAERGRRELAQAIETACHIDIDDPTRVSIVSMGNASVSLSLLVSFRDAPDAARFAAVAKVFMG